VVITAGPGIVRIYARSVNSPAPRVLIRHGTAATYRPLDLAQSTLVTEASERAQLILEAAGISGTVGSVSRIDDGRGVFSIVERIHLIDSSLGHATVAIKHGLNDVNGQAAISSGAYQREALAYEVLLPATGEVLRPECFGVVRHSAGAISFVLEDLSSCRSVDQLVGLSRDDIAGVVAELLDLHVSWSINPQLMRVDVRRDTPSHLAADGLVSGLDVIDEVWSSILHDEQRASFHSLVSHRKDAVAQFVGEGGETLCHGDPRADNVAFRGDRRAVLFDWQQLAVQFGEADLAWLLATSATPDVRREVEAELVASYAIARGQDAATTWRRYRTGMILPGLAVLFLAQRSATHDRTRDMIGTSLRRIATAIDDLAVVDLIRT